MSWPTIDCATLCPLGHRGYQRVHGFTLDELRQVSGRCPTCGGDARLSPLPAHPDPKET